jgi:hypothetical protein
VLEAGFAVKRINKLTMGLRAAVLIADRRRDRLECLV